MAIGKGISPFLKKFKGVSYNAITSAFIAEVTAQGGTLTATEKTAINTFTTAFDLSTNMDRFYLRAAQDSVAARISIVNPTSTITTAVNSPTHAAGLGWTGNGTTSYLNSNYRPDTQAVKYTLNSASYGCYLRTVLGSNTGLPMGLNSGSTSQFTPSFSGGNALFGINGSGNSSGTSSVSTGHFYIERSGSANVAYYRNGTSVATATTASTSLGNSQFYSLCTNTGSGAGLFSTNQLALEYYGQKVADPAAFNTAVAALATTLGFNV